MVLLAAFAVAGAGCKREDEANAPSLSALKPQPLPSGVLDLEPTDAGAAHRERAYAVEAAPVFGDPLPQNAARLELRGEKATMEGAPVDAPRLGGRPVLIAYDADTFLAQAADTLAALDRAGAQVFLLHPDGQVAFPVDLRDEREFQTWLDADSAAARLRVIHRADGYELQTHLGKVTGYDPNGPSVPLRGGNWDVARFRSLMQKLQSRFDRDDTVCHVPSFGMELRDIALALTGYYSEPKERMFPTVCLVYPQASARPADAGGKN